MQSPAAHFTQLGTTSFLHVHKSDYEFHIKKLSLSFSKKTFFGNVPWISTLHSSLPRSRKRLPYNLVHLAVCELPFIQKVLSHYWPLPI